MNCPTGYNPKLMWSPSQQDIWNRMKNENHPWYQIIIGNSARTEDGTSKRYASIGRWEALAYLITGDRVYGRAALSQVKSAAADFDVNQPYYGNGQREYGTEFVMLYEWLKPVLTSAEDTAYINWLKATAEKTLQGERFGDSDQMTGCYLALAALEKITSAGYLNRTIPDSDTGKVLPVGGLISTGANRDTMRNCITLFCKMADGGQWIESSDYNKGTPDLLYLGVEAIDGRLSFPEVSDFRAKHARYLMHERTPDLKDEHQWGDVEHPHDAAWHELNDMYEIVPALLEKDGYIQLAAEFRQFADDARLANNQTFAVGAQPLYARSFYFANPYAARSDWKANVGNTLITKGTGHVYIRSGWTPTDKSFHLWSQRFGNGGVDHQLPVGSDLSIYSNGKWILGHPLCYTPDNWYHNQQVVNRTNSSEYGEIIGFGYKKGDVGYAAGINAGLPPMWAFTFPIDNHGCVRHVFALMDEDTYVVFDVMHVTDPRDRPNWETLYTYQSNVDLIKSMKAPKDIVWHMPVSPNITGNVISWDKARIVNLPEMNYEIVDEKTATDIAGYINPNEKKFLVHATPKVKQDFDVFASVFMNDNSNIAAPVSTIGGEPVSAVMVMRATDNKVFVVSAKQGPKLEVIDDGTGHNKLDPDKRASVLKDARLLKQGFKLSLSAPAKIYIADLDQSLIWNINGTPLIKQDDFYFSDVPVMSCTVQAVGAVPIPEPTPIPNPIPPMPTPDNPKVTVKDWSRSLKVGEFGFVLFDLFVPKNHKIILVRLILTDSKGTEYISKVPNSENAIAGVKFPTLPVGTYRLNVEITDDNGGFDRSQLKREVIVK